MRSKCYLRVSSVILLLALGATEAAGASIRLIEGAWVMGGADCSEIFTKSGKNLRFRTPNSLTNTGIIVAGNKIAGPNATCTAERVRKEGNHLSALLTCSNAVIFGTVSVAFKLIDQEHFLRIDPNFPDFSFSYRKCHF